jgi:3-deoxy-manno-octulosonate cytidylyltransferase (CMP-KDO synthetase)
MNTVIVIPARYASTRYPGKPLIALRGADGISRSLVERSWRAACAVSDVTRILVATDDERIAEHARGFGAEVAMTSPVCRNGTERCAEVLDALDETPDLIVNLQGDAPLTPPDFVGALIAAMAARDDVAVATPVLRCDAAALTRFREDRKAGRVGGTTAVFDRGGRALYFSKEVIPYADAIDLQAPELPVFHHVGLYAYRPAALNAYAQWAQGSLETLEGLEQLRFLENGTSVLCVEVEAAGRVFWELNNPVDVARLEQAMADMAMP